MAGDSQWNSYTRKPTNEALPARGVAGHLAAAESQFECSDFQTPSSERRAGPAPEHINPGRVASMLIENLQKVMNTLTLFFFALGFAGAGIGFATLKLKDFTVKTKGITVQMHAKSPVPAPPSHSKQKKKSVAP